MRTVQRSHAGQSTLELFLLLPILMVLLGIIIHAYHVNHESSQSSVSGHIHQLERFNHGLGTITIDEIEFAPGDIITLIPPSTLDLQDVITQVGAKIGVEIGLGKLFSKIGFLNGDSFAAGFLKSGATSAAGSFVGSGFKSVDWESAAWAAVAGGFSSGEASRWFQGQNVTASSVREAFGSAAQGAVVGFAGSEGDVKGAAQGAVGGLFSSDTYQGLEAGNVGMGWGVAKGAIQSTVTGALNGQLDSKTVLVGALNGGMSSGQAARLLTLGTFKGDPRQSALYQGVNASVATVLQGGNAKDAAVSAVSSAFYSGQTLATLQGQSGIGRELTAVGFGTASGLLQGQSAEGVGLSALQSLAYAEASRMNGQLGQATANLVQNASTVAEIKKNLEGAQARLDAVKELTGEGQEAEVAAARTQRNSAVAQALVFSMLAFSQKGQP